MKSKNLRVFFSLVSFVGLLILILLLGGQQKPSCGPIIPEEPVCEVPEDCEGLPHILCVGEWLCEEGQCIWDCTPPKPKKCIKTGCSGEVCAEKHVYTPCIYLPWFECLKFSKCGNFGPDGNCAWLETPEYLECMEKFKKGCLSDEDCPDGFYCKKGPCPMAPCKIDENGKEWCPPCYGKCVPKEEEFCESDNDCPKGKYCKFENIFPGEDGNAKKPDIYLKGKCVDIPEGLCVGDKDCEEGFECKKEICPLCFNCPCFGKCVPKQKGCLSDEDCPEGFYCVKKGICIDCAPDSEDCIPGCFYEGEGVCMPKIGECKTDKDCPKGYYCDPCGCPPNALCFPCIPKCMPLPLKKCFSDKDCGFGFYCDKSNCTIMPCAPDVPDCKPPQCEGVCKKDCKDVYCPMIMCPPGQKMDPCTCQCVYLPD